MNTQRYPLQQFSVFAFPKCNSNPNEQTQNYTFLENKPTHQSLL